MSWEVIKDLKKFMAAFVTQCYYCQKRTREKEGRGEGGREKSALGKVNISCLTDKYV